MKIRLRCLLFGHCFIVKQDYIREKDGHPMTRVCPVDYCANCGLSKEELKVVA